MTPPSSDQKSKALAFRSLHHGSKPLLLPNVWDIASARVVEECGYPALATTSAGIAFSLGYPDGQKISRDEMIAAIARIARSVKIPVSADVEAGYSPKADGAAGTARRVIEAGAVGINLEDSTGDRQRPLADLGMQVEKIRAVREAALKTGVLLVVNARTDVYLDQVGPPESRYDETVRRLLAFRDAGADCVFAPGLRDLETIRRLVKDVQCPLNILGGPGTPAVGELHTAGVARVSLGSGPMRATLGLLRRIAEELNTNGTFASLHGAPSLADVNRLLS